MVGRRGGLQSIPRDGETWLQAAHILGCWFHFPHSAQQREGERCDAPRRHATQAQLRRAAQVWCNQWCTRLFVFESALYITASSQPISSSCCHASRGWKASLKCSICSSARFFSAWMPRCLELKAMIAVVKQAVVHKCFTGFVKSHLAWSRNAPKLSHILGLIFPFPAGIITELIRPSESVIFSSRLSLYANKVVARAGLQSAQRSLYSRLPFRRRNFYHWVMTTVSLFQMMANRLRIASSVRTFCWEQLEHFVPFFGCT